GQTGAHVLKTGDLEALVQIVNDVENGIAIGEIDKDTVGEDALQAGAAASKGARSNSISVSPSATRWPDPTKMRATRVGPGAASSAKRPGRGVTVPMARTTRANGCAVAAAVCTAPAPRTPPASLSSAAARTRQPAGSAASASSRPKRLTAGPPWR